MDNQNERRELIADTLKKPIMLLWVMICPQALLAILNVGAWTLVRGDMSAEQMRMSAIIGSFELVIFLIGFAGWLGLKHLKQQIDWKVCIGLLVVHIAYLWLFTAQLWQLLPDGVTVWILQPTQLSYYQFALMMPAIFYAAIRLAGFGWDVNRWMDFGVTLGALIGVPVAWFGFVHLIDALWRHWDVPYLVFVVFFVASTVLVLVAFLRLLLFLYGMLIRLRHGAFVLPLLTGIFAPIGGLLLNIKIPFPYDFQSVHIYVLTVLNGTILLLPLPRKHSLALTVWILRAVMYSFSLYFFVVFLPYLPLSLLAMIAAGAGFLILAPTLLFVVHTRRLIEEGRMLAGRWGATHMIILFLFCLLTLPAGFTGRALIHRTALREAINAVYTPDYRTGVADVNLKQAEWSLRRLRAMKDGLFVPFLTDAYDRIVFDGMVLPDYKMDEIATVLFGKNLEFEKPSNRRMDLWFGGGRERRQRWRNTPPPPRNVRLASINNTTREADGLVKAEIMLTMTNAGTTQAEFVTDINLPEGVLVSGYWLDVEGVKVPGRVFEKRVAMWVYHMIRDATRRDPGLVVFTSDQRLQLRVFPFSAHQERTTGISFLYPAGLDPVIRVGNEEIDLASESEPRVTRVSVGNADWVVVPAGLAREYPRTTRIPYLHFIIDRSADAEDADGDFADRMQAIAHEAGIDAWCMTAANFEFQHVMDSPIADEEIGEMAPAGIDLPFRGSLCPERAIKGALLDLLDKGSQIRVTMVPVFVVIAAEGTELVVQKELSSFRHLVPDMPAYFIDTGEGQLERRDFSDGASTRVEQLPVPEEVIVMRADTSVAVCDAESGGVGVLMGSRGATLEVRDGDEYRAVDAADLLDESRYSRGVRLWEAYRATRYDPATEESERADIVTGCRETGILTPLASYIVVESAAQWEILKRKEGQSLKAHGAMAFDEFMESPEPSVLWFLPVVYMIYRSRRKRRETALNT